jgi:trimeric autotransporter adhesin
MTKLLVPSLLLFFSPLGAFAQTNMQANPSITTTGSIPIQNGTSNQFEQVSGLTYDCTNRILTLPIASGAQGLSINTSDGNQLLTVSYDLSLADTFFGPQAGPTSFTGFTGQNNVMFGIHDGNALTSGTGNVCFGHDNQSSTTTGNNNTSLGYQALRSNVTGSDSTAIGWSTLKNSTGGAETGLGYGSLYSATSSGGDTGVGFEACQNMIDGNENTCVGFQSGNGLTHGGANTFVGYKADAGGDYNYCTAIGYEASCDASHHIVLGTSSESTVIPSIKATTGTRFVCVDTTGKLISQATACSGT